jgi:hypothetical protein
VTLLFPVQGYATAAPAVKALGTGDPQGLVFEDDREIIRFGEQDVAVERG